LLMEGFTEPAAIIDKPFGNEDERQLRGSNGIGTHE